MAPPGLRPERAQARAAHATVGADCAGGGDLGGARAAVRPGPALRCSASLRPYGALLIVTLLCAGLSGAAAVAPAGFFDGVQGVACGTEQLHFADTWANAGCFADSYWWLDGRNEVFGGYAIGWGQTPESCQAAAAAYGYTSAGLSSYYGNNVCYGCAGCDYSAYGSARDCSNGVGGDLSVFVYTTAAPVLSVADCADACLANANCGGFLYGGLGLGSGGLDTCDLRKFASTSAQATATTPTCFGTSDGASASGVWYTRRDASFFTVQQDIDLLYGNDIWYDASATSGDACAAACMREQTCAGVVLVTGQVDRNGCWYKSSWYWAEPTAGATAYVRQGAGNNFDSSQYARATTSACQYYSTPGCCAATTQTGGLVGNTVSDSASLSLGTYWSGWSCAWSIQNPNGAFLSTTFANTCHLGGSTLYVLSAQGCQDAYTSESSFMLYYYYDSSWGNIPANAGFTLSIDYTPGGVRPVISYFSLAASLSCTGDLAPNVTTASSLSDCATQCISSIQCGGFTFAASTCTMTDFVYRRVAPTADTPGCVASAGDFYLRGELSYFQETKQTACYSDGTTLVTMYYTTVSQCASACLSEPSCKGFSAAYSTCVIQTISALANPSTCYGVDDTQYSFYSRLPSSSTTYSPCLAGSSPGCCAASRYSSNLPSDGRVSDVTATDLLQLMVSNPSWDCAWLFGNPWQSQLYSSFSIVDSGIWYQYWSVDAGSGAGKEASTTGDLLLSFTSASFYSMSSVAFSLSVASFAALSSSDAGGGGSGGTVWLPDSAVINSPSGTVNFCSARPPADANYSWPLNVDFSQAPSVSDVGTLEMIVSMPGGGIGDASYNIYSGTTFTNAAYASAYNPDDGIGGLTFGGSSSIAFWTFIGTGTGGTNAPFFTMYNGTVLGRKTVVTEQLMYTAKGEISYTSALGGRQAVTVDYAFEESTWYHLAAVFEPNAATAAAAANNTVGSTAALQGIVTLYVNGDPVTIGPLWLPAPIRRNVFNIGRPQKPSANNPVFQGGFADVNVFNRALSPAEVAYLYGGCSSSAPEPRVASAPALSLADISLDYAQLLSLDLSGYGLSGSIPLSLTSLTALQTMDLSENIALSGEIPNLTALSALVSLDLTNCNFTTFASDYDAAATLTKLVVVNNSLSGAIPVHPGLAIVDASNNKLTGLTLTNNATCSLEELTLDNNNIVVVAAGPITIKCKTLARLSITDNALRDAKQSDAAPASFNNLLAPGLQSLNVARNYLTGAALKSVSALANLTSLDLSGNEMNGVSLPNTLFSGILTSLDLHSSGIVGTIPSVTGVDEKGNPVYFSLLNLASNALVGVIPDTLAVSAAAGSMVFLNDNSLSGTIPVELLMGAAIVNVASNKLSGSIPAQVSTNPQLIGLLVGNNRLSGSIPSSFTDATQLLICSLSDSLAGQGNNFTCALPVGFATKMKACTNTMCNCRAGAFFNATTGDCSACKPGTQSAESSTSCTACAVGSVAPASSASCTRCLAGTYANTVTFSCTPCAVGQFSAQNGSSTCSSCAAGSVTLNKTGSPACTVCAAGAFANPATDLCEICQPGTYSDAGSTTCTACDPGSVSLGGVKTCSKCPAGTYANTANNTCDTCPSGSSAPTAGTAKCVPNPAGYASTERTTFQSAVTLAGAASFSAAQSATLTQALAATLGVDASGITITGTAAGVARRRLNIAATIANYTVVSEDPDVSKTVRSTLGNASSLGSALQSALRASSDPVLSAISGLTLAAPTESSVVLGAAPCAAGTYLDSVSSRCRACDARLVTLSTGETACSPCPATSARANASTCTPCPANSKASVLNPSQCACNPDYYDTLFGANLVAPDCVVCPRGGACVTGFVAARQGFWRETTRSDVFYRCRENYCLAEEVVGPLTRTANVSAGRRSLLQAPAVEPTNCVAGNTGPLCAVCMPGYSMQSGQCLPCDPADSWERWHPGTKAVLLVFCILGALVVIAYLFFQPLVPGLERSAAAMADGLRGSFAKAKSKATCGCLEPAKETDEKEKAEGKAESEDDGPIEVAPAWDSSAAAPSAAHDEPGPVSEGLVTPRTSLDQESRRLHTPDRRRTELVGHAQLEATKFKLEADAALAVGTAGQMADAVTSAGGEDHAEDAVGHTLDVMDNLEEIMESLRSALAQAQKFGKIILNFYQIVTTFLKSLDIPWPATFGVVMTKINIVNLNLAQLPKAACLNPTPSYFSQFNGYTLGLLFAELSIGAMWLFGTKLLAPISLRHLPERVQRERLSQFNSTVLSRLLLMLYVVYPGVSVAIFGIFSCTTFASGRSFLDADFHIMCYTQKHWNYIGAAVIWLVVVTLGIPAFFVVLLQRFRVPDLARLLADNAWLREAVELAWTEGVAQPSLTVADINCDTIEDRHLESLYAFFCCDRSAEEAAEILNGSRAPIDPEAEARKHEEEEASQHPDPKTMTKLEVKLEAVKERARTAAQSARAAQHRLRKSLEQRCLPRRISEPGTPVTPVVVKTRRERTLEELLAWCKTSGELSIPTLVWSELPDGTTEEMEAEADANALPQSKDPIRCADIARLQRRAMSQVGFLFAAYRMDCWYWETVELLRKLALTSILALIAPGSAGQVVVGLLLAFVMLLFNLALKPYAEKAMNLVNIIAQLNLFFFLFVALLLKVNLDGQGSAQFFGGIIAAMSILPIALPLVMRAYIQMYGSLEMRMLVKDSKWDSN